MDSHSSTRANLQALEKCWLGRGEMSLFLLAPVVLDQTLCPRSLWECRFSVKKCVTQVWVKHFLLGCARFFYGQEHEKKILFSFQGSWKVVRASEDNQTPVLLKVLSFISTLSTSKVGGSVTDARADWGLLIEKLIIFCLFFSSFIAKDRIVVNKLGKGRVRRTHSSLIFILSHNTQKRWQGAGCPETYAPWC